MGPFQIVHQLSPVSFELALPNHYRVSPTFHVSLLKPGDGPNGGGEEAPRGNEPLPVMVEGKFYQVRELLNSRHRGRIVEYFVERITVQKKDLG